MREILLIVILIAAGYFVFDYYQKSLTPDSVVINVNGNVVEAEVARIRRDKERGLSSRDSLSENRGMLFIYKKSGFYGMWMKDMKFALDIIWISEDWRVVHIEENIVPETYPDIFYPNKPANYVLELNAGVSSRLDIVVGTVLCPTGTKCL